MTAPTRTRDPEALRATLMAYGLAIIVPLIATALTFGLNRALGGNVGFPIDFVAVAIVGWRAGLGPGLLATFICAIGEPIVFIDPAGSEALELARLALFAVACVVASVLTDRLRASQQRARERGLSVEEREERLRLAIVDRDRLLAAERQIQEIRDAFIEVLSHELRTPMTTIVGGAELLERGHLGPQRGGEVAHDVREEAERMIRLIEDLLVLSRAERGSLEISDEPVLVQRVVDRVAQDIKRRQPMLEVEIALAPDLPPVRGELTYVEQVLRNLVGNAAKYGPPEGPIRLAGSVVEGFVEIQVLDAGPGVPRDDLERVFDLFFRSRETAARVSGAGIGLFVSRQLVDLMGGRIWAHQRAGGGSEFGFTLPLESDDDLD
ncbi:MAG: sensor histidine kinase [Candidatus Limnocylindrales bacterium]